MAKSSSGGSSLGGGKRGLHQTATMTAGKAKSLQGSKGGKPNLDKVTMDQTKVTNKPKSGKMK